MKRIDSLWRRYSESFVDDMPQEGDVSAFIANLTSLQRVKLSKNQLRFDLSKLKLPEGVSSVDLSSNLVTGSLSSLLNSKTSWFLEEAHLSNNQISGRIPDFSECLNVKVLNIGNNKIGDVSAFIANLTSLQRVKLSKNQLRFDLSKLKLPEGVSSVDLSSNLVTGSLSSLLNSKTSWFLEEAHLSNNQISGRIPDFSECLNVKVLNIGNNKIGGQIPSSISNLFELVRLDISRNHITGVIPQGLGHSSSSTG
ncbi:hypothetical protein Bca52824_060965 [Brassica carinata]|uniref:Uncharacterized protein n=1 Tax=Brassica carinata TaxID=52824 RepID=A0A8X7R106_BRACI|nr:hypothetical protein Bca52824_060965 [Brassica carinata]